MNLNYEQQLFYVKAINDRLLHKYIAEVTDAKWKLIVNSSIICLLVIPLGIFAHLGLGLGLSITILYCTFWVCSGICDTIIAYPLSKSQIAKTPTQALSQTLLEYSWRNKVTNAIRLPIFIGLSIWLALDLRHALNIHFLGFEISNRIADFAFWVALLITVVAVLDIALQAFIFTPKKINGLVRDIHKMNCTNIGNVPYTY